MFISEVDIGCTDEQEYVELIISGDDTPWEGGINGKFFRISRNIPVRVPRYLAKLIFANQQVTILSKENVKQYKSGNGKCLSSTRKEVKT